MDFLHPFSSLSGPLRPVLLLSLSLSFLAKLATASVLSSGHHCREPSQVELARDSQLNSSETFAYSSGATLRSLNHDACSATSDPVCICRTHQKANYDEGRIPKVLVQTSCCHVNPHIIHRWRTFCKNITHRVQVFRRIGCVNGVYQYRLAVEEIPVGCSCASERL